MGSLVFNLGVNAYYFCLGKVVDSKSKKALKARLLARKKAESDRHELDKLMFQAWPSQLK